MLQFLACDHKWLCYCGLVTLHCLLLASGFICLVSLPTVREEVGTQLVTAAQLYLLRQQVLHPGCTSVPSDCQRENTIFGLHGYECAPQTLINSETAQVLWG